MIIYTYSFHILFFSISPDSFSEKYFCNFTELLKKICQREDQKPGISVYCTSALNN